MDITTITIGGMAPPAEALPGPETPWRGRSAWTSAINTTISTDSGKRHIDFTSGAILANVGHAAPRVVSALREHLSHSRLHSYCYGSPEETELELQLLQWLGQAFTGIAFATTGSEAIELVLRLCWRHAARNWPGDRDAIIVSARNGFHGKSLGAATLSGISRYKVGPARDYDWCRQIDFPGGDRPEAWRELESLVHSQNVAAVILECVQGSSLDCINRSAAREIRRICSENDSLLVIDEIQTGFYRAGERLALDRVGIQADIVCLGKGLTSSLPLACVAVTRQAHSLIDRSLDGSTNCCNPLCAAAALACLEEYRSVAFQSSRTASARAFQRELEMLGSVAPAPIRVRSCGGHLAGLEFHAVDQGLISGFVDRCRDDGLFLGYPIGERRNLVKLSPPLMISNDEIARGFQTMRRILEGCIR